MCPCWLVRGRTAREGITVRTAQAGSPLQHHFPIGSYVPVSDETIDELKAQSLLSSERFLDLLIDKIGYTNYLKNRSRSSQASGDPRLR